MILSFRSHKFVTPVFGIFLRSFLVFILAKYRGSFNKFSTCFLRSLDSSLFFRKWIFCRNRDRVICAFPHMRR